MATQIRVKTQDDTRIVYLDLSSDQPMTANYQFKDIQKFDSNKGNHTYNFRVPATTNNDLFFAMYFEVTQYGNFNPKAKVEASIEKDTISVFEGFLQLTNVIVKNDTQNYYECVVFSSVSSIGQVLEGKLLSEFDWSAYNHTQSFNTIVTSMDRDVTPLLNGDIVYSMNDYGTGFVGGSSAGSFTNQSSPIDLRRLRPFIRISAIIKTILEQSGFNYVSEFIDTEISDCYLELNKGGESVLTTLISDFHKVVVHQGTDQVLTIPANSGNTYHTLIYDDVSNVNYANASLSYNTTTGVYDPTPDWAQTFITISCVLDCSSNMNGTEVLLCLFNTTTGQIDEQDSSPIILDSANPVTQTFNSYSSAIDLNQVYEVRIVVMGVTNSTSGTITLTGGSINLLPLNGSSFTSTGPYFDWVTTSPIVEVGQNFAKMKAVDFLKSLAKKFNLVITPDKLEATTIHIDTYNNWIDTGNTLDWTDKLNTSKDVQLKPTAELQAKSLSFTDNKGADFYNTSFESQVGRIYGTQVVDNNSNDFGKEKLEVKTEFTPTITTYIENSPIRHSRCYKEDMSNPESLRLAIYSGVQQPVTFSIYGTINPLNPAETGVMAKVSMLTNYSANPISTDTWALSFMPEITAFANELTPINGAYQRFYKRFLSETYSRDARIMTGTFHLSSLDIMSMNFNDLIFVKDTYFRINKISNYSLVGESTCKVELVKVEQVNVIDSLGVECTSEPYVYFNDGEVQFSLIGSTGPSFVPSQACCEAYNLVFHHSRCNVFVGGNVTAPTELPDDIKFFEKNGSSVIKGNHAVGGMNNVVLGLNNQVTELNDVIGVNNKMLNTSSHNVVKGNENTITNNVKLSDIIGSNNKIDPYRLSADYYGTLIFGNQNIENASIKGNYALPLCTGDNFISGGEDRLYNTIGRSGSGHFVKEIFTSGKENFQIGVNGKFNQKSGSGYYDQAIKECFRLQYPSSIYLTIQVFGQERGTTSSRSQKYSKREYTGVVQNTSNSLNPYVNIKEVGSQTEEDSLFNSYTFNAYAISALQNPALELICDGMFNFEINTNPTSLGIVDWTIDAKYTLVGLQNLARGGSGGPFTPTEISGCLLWLDAYDPSTFVFDSGSTTDIDTWEDKSGNNHDVSRLVSGNFPTLETASVGAPITSVGFDGGSQAFINTTSSLYNYLNSDNTIFVVFKSLLDAPLSAGSFVAGSVYRGKQENGININATSGSGGGADATAYLNNGGSLSAYVNAKPVTEIQAVYGYRNGTTAFVGDQLGNTNASTNALNRNANSFCIGGAEDRRVQKGMFRGEVYEVIAYDTQLSTSQIDVVMNYLTTKWNT